MFACFNSRTWTSRITPDGCGQQMSLIADIQAPELYENGLSYFIQQDELILRHSSAIKFELSNNILD